MNRLSWACRRVHPLSSGAKNNNAASLLIVDLLDERGEVAYFDRSSGDIRGYVGSVGVAG